MAETILQINYKFNSSRADHTALVTPMAEYIAAVPGLVWKVWLMNEAEHEAGGIYLFESGEEAQAFVSSAAVTGFAAHPSLTAFSVKRLLSTLGANCLLVKRWTFLSTR